MKEIEKEITTKQVVYEITKEELERIKANERIKGRRDIINYLRFSIGNYQYELNLGGIKSLVSDIVDFINDKTNGIENTYDYSFEEYISKRNN